LALTSKIGLDPGEYSRFMSHFGLFVRGRLPWTS
jgi:hypothetical protein